MKATDLLEAQHREVEDLFERIEEADDDEKGEIFEELASHLVAHDAIEREIFYPACEREMGMTDLLGEAMVEHGVVEFCLFQAQQAEGDDTFDFKVTVLQEVIEHHVEEEEKELFPKVEKALGKAMLEELGATMEARFEKARAADFRGPLLENLRRVLEGAIKPDGQRGKAEGRHAKGATRKAAAPEPAGRKASAKKPVAHRKSASS